ncbi:MAG: hypothetical protein M1812_005672 [Candelaria pacifica]|nr:MAG: hypothetical protein M1812_005672 [Candelaria pacifica]
MTSFGASLPVAPSTVSPPEWRHQSGSSDPNRLAPEDAFFAHSPPRRRRPVEEIGSASDTHDGHKDAAVNGPQDRTARGNRRRRDRERGRSGSRRRKGVWKKILWVKQPYPDNYTDEETFLDHLQRNPRMQPYEFWPLFADSTVIIQHVCSVIIFVSCFVGIFQERVSPVAVVSWGSLGTVLGWGLWDWWVGQEEAASLATETAGDTGQDGSGASSGTSSVIDSEHKEPLGLGLTILGSTPAPRQGHSHSASITSIHSSNSALSPVTSGHPTGAANFASYSYYPPYGAPASSFSPRNQQRIATAKSAILIYCALLGLSPILKSLTQSTTSDSIWAMSCWLMCINVFFFDYGGGVGVKFPASLSTNAALMASTVLASRLPSTTHVFSLTLFSIEVFGLFPVFRRHLRHMSWHGHLSLTVFLVVGAGGGVGVTVSGGGWKAGTAGVVLGGLLTALAMGGCSWWLIGLQRYKMEIHGPWDPARPILRRHWD